MLGWGSLEYGTVGFTPGQVIGGRWKPLHHEMRNHLYRDVITVCGAAGVCFVRNDDALSAYKGSVSLTLLQLKTSKLVPIKPTLNISIARGAAAFAYFCLGGGDAVAGTCASVSSVLSDAGCAADGTDCLLSTQTTSVTGALSDSDWALLSTPSQIAAAGALPRAHVSATVAGAPLADGSVPIAVTTDAPALFVTLTTLAQGRFEPNFITLPAAGTTTLRFLPFAGFDLAELEQSLRVDHAARYL